MDGEMEGKQSYIFWMARANEPLPEINVCYANHELKDWIRLYCHHDYIFIISSGSFIFTSATTRKRQVEGDQTKTSGNGKKKGAWSWCNRRSSLRSSFNATSAKRSSPSWPTSTYLMSHTLSKAINTSGPTWYQPTYHIYITRNNTNKFSKNVSLSLHFRLLPN